jgi:tetratricopeptide (TPR) repeat protein
MDELTPEQRKHVEENYATTGVFNIDMASKDAEIKMRSPNAGELTDAAYKLFKKGHIQEAMAKAQEAINQYPDYLPAYRVMADMLQENGAADKSIPLYDKILANNPDDDETYMNRGYAYGRLNQMSRAIEDYNKALELNPRAKNALSARASAYAKMGNMDLAKKDYENLMEFSEEQACFGLGNVAAYDGHWDEALNYYDRTIAVSPNFAPVYIMKGQILLQLGREQEAAEAIKKAKSLGMVIPPDLDQLIE